MASLQLSFHRFFFISFLFLTGLAQAQSEPAIPELWGMRIHDEAKVLNAGFISQLENQLKTFEDSTSNQIAVLVIQTLDGYPLESYSLKVAEKWQLGTKKNDNGVLLLVVIQDRKIRIEVGQGLEGILTDAATSRIIRNEIAPAFRRQDYEAGIQAGIDAVLNTIQGEYTSEEAKGINDFEVMSKGEKLVIGIFIFGLLGVFTLFAILTSGCAGWGLYAFLIPFYAVFPILVVGASGGIIALIAYLILVPILKLIIPKTEWGKRIQEKIKENANNKNRGGGNYGGGWFIGGGGSGGGWSSGGGGFSGGGGSFGGGGSSGSW
jgi:uncharacterized protein